MVTIKALDEVTPADLWREVPLEEEFWGEARERQRRLLKALLEEALEEERSGDLDDAERRYREALETDGNNRPARLGLGRILAERGDVDEARRTLMPLLPDVEAERLLASLEVASWRSLSEPGTLASAKRLAAQGKWREALDGMLGALSDDPDARQAMLEVFAVLGDDDAVVAEYRRKLANALF